MAAAVNAPVSVMKTAGEGGAWGMAILAAYMLDKAEDEMLDTYLSDKVFAGKKEQRSLQMKKMWKALMNLSNNIKKVLHLNELQLMSCKKETKDVRTIKKRSL